MEYELKTTKEELQHTIEDFKASNEELMSVNEELQSSNEELETSKEELQSLNEELSTSNTQLEGKIGSWKRPTTTSKFYSPAPASPRFFSTTAFASAVFTPAATKTLQPHPDRTSAAHCRRGAQVHRSRSPFGRSGPCSIGQSAPKRRSASRQTAGGTSGRFCLTARTPAGPRAWWLRFPTSPRRRFWKRGSMPRRSCDTVREPLLVLDADLHVISANRAFYSEFHVAEKETVGQPLYELGNEEWDIPELRTLLAEVSAAQKGTERLRGGARIPRPRPTSHAAQRTRARSWR
jgi:hypothetical protein